MLILISENEKKNRYGHLKCFAKRYVDHKSLRWCKYSGESLVGTCGRIFTEVYFYALVTWYKYEIHNIASYDVGYYYRNVFATS